MAYQDRHYYRDNGSGAFNPFTWLMTGSVPLFTAFGIRVRIHAAMILFIAFQLIFAGSPSGLGVKNAAISMSFLFIGVLLHEFGHCFGARWVGGSADDILMWPLGGLAYTAPPHRWDASFITTAAGPATSLLLCLISGAVFLVMGGSLAAIPWLPLQPLTEYIPAGIAFYAWWFFTVNYALFMFNMCLVFYPFDAGRMIQELLWWRIGYYRSMMVATTIGMVGAVGLAVFAIAAQWWMLLFIGILGFYTCLRQRQTLLQAGPEDFADSTDYSAAYETFTPPKPRRRNKRAAQRALKLARQEMEERERIDRILAKVSAQGMQSLTWLERRALRKATEHQRQRDEELSRIRGE